MRSNGSLQGVAPGSASGHVSLQREKAAAAKKTSTLMLALVFRAHAFLLYPSNAFLTNQQDLYKDFESLDDAQKVSKMGNGREREREREREKRVSLSREH